MVRRKTFTKILKSGLILCLVWSIQNSLAQSYQVGAITQLEGQVSFFDFFKKQIIPLKKNQDIFTSGSYLTQDDSFLTVKIVGGHYLRLNPKSKISIEYEPEDKTLRVILLAGSVKALKFKSKNSTIDKIFIQSGATTFEASEGKFSVNRNLIDDSSNVYVEKGLVIVGQTINQTKSDMELVHQGEMLSVTDKQIDLDSAWKMKDKEKKFLHPSFYLNSKTKKNYEIDN